MQHYVYSAFGSLKKVLDVGKADITGIEKLAPYFSYTNREYDSESGMYYYRARFYDSSIGRFVQEDPDPGSLNSSITINNRYVYAGNMPTRYEDPSGEIFGISALAFITISTVVGAVAGGIHSDWNPEETFFSAFKAAALASAIVGVGALANGVGAGFSGGSFLSFFNGLGVSSAAFSIGAQTTAAVLAVPAIIGAYDKGASNDLRKYTKAFGLLGAAGNALQGAVFVAQGFGLEIGASSGFLTDATASNLSLVAERSYAYSSYYFGIASASYALTRPKLVPKKE